MNPPGDPSDKKSINFCFNCCLLAWRRLPNDTHTYVVSLISDKTQLFLKRVSSRLRVCFTYNLKRFALSLSLWIRQKSYWRFSSQIRNNKSTLITYAAHVFAIRCMPHVAAAKHSSQRPMNFKTQLLQLYGIFTACNSTNNNPWLQTIDICRQQQKRY